MVAVTPHYRIGAWPTGGDIPAAPFGYAGTSFDFQVIAQRVLPVDDEHVNILGVTIEAYNILFETPGADPDYPIYFEVAGNRYLYLFSLWDNWVEIEVCSRFSRFMYKQFSCMFPVTEEEFLRALTTVVDDCSQAEIPSGT